MLDGLRKLFGGSGISAEPDDNQTIAGEFLDQEIDAVRQTANSNSAPASQSERQKKPSRCFSVKSAADPILKAEDRTLFVRNGSFKWRVN